MYILAIETSCDETAASILEIKNSKLEIRSNVVSSQVDIHRKYGGIVPEVAARAHIEKIIPVIDEAIIKSGIRNPKSEINLVAVTNGPGLITSLLVGTETAKTLSYIWRKPLMPVNHLIGHIYAAFGSEIRNSEFEFRKIFPAICLVVSGGHTELVLMKGHGQFQKIGQTLDDAAGECFDKVAKLLDIGYPGGPAIAAEATKYRNIDISKYRVRLPRPMINTKDYNFSFSGLKTAVLYTVKNQKFELTGSKKQITQKLKKIPQKVRSERQQFVAAMCAEVQQAVIDVLISKTIRAARDFGVKTVILCGGVAANEELRRQLEEKCYNLAPHRTEGSISGLKVNFLMPPKNLCTDNAAMIAAAAYFQWQRLSPTFRKNLKNNWRKLEVDSNLEIGYL